MMEDDDIPTVDANDVPEGAFDGVDGIPDVNVSDFDADGVANSVVDVHDSVMGAIESAVAHTLIDEAGDEVFVDRVEPATIRDAVRDAVWSLEDAGYGFDNAAIYAGTGAVDKLREALPGRENDRFVGDGAALHVDGIDVFETSNMPKNIAVAVDPNALARIPPGVVRRRVGIKDTATVTSPVMVRDKNGVAVVNIAED